MKTDSSRQFEETDQARAAQLEEFTKELSRRLASLDRGKTVDPAVDEAYKDWKNHKEGHTIF